VFVLQTEIAKLLGSQLRTDRRADIAVAKPVGLFGKHASNKYTWNGSLPSFALECITCENVSSDFGDIFMPNQIIV
jgi:hypothetical protein